MPFAGDFTPPTSPGETQTFSLNFAPQMASSDTITGATTTLGVLYGNDPTPPSWLIGPAVIAGQVVSQLIGGALPNGLQPGCIYLWTVTVTTASGDTLINSGRISCQSLPTTVSN